MDRRSTCSAVSVAVPFRGLRFADYKLYLFMVALVALGVALPNLFHRFGILGPSLLPMQFIVLLAGLILGWRAGLLAGAVSPLASYLLSGMPLAVLLPQLILENAAYGFFAGYLREKANFGILKSLVLSMLAGRLLLLIGVTFFYWGRAIPSPAIMPWTAGILPAEISPLTYMAAVIVQGLPGLAVQLLLIPSAVSVADRWLQKS